MIVIPFRSGALRMDLWLACAPLSYREWICTYCLLACSTSTKYQLRDCEFGASAITIS